MGYINERVPKEEVKSYRISEYREEKPFCWTIDREKDIKFFKYWTNIDDPEESYYALVWGDIVIDLTLRQRVKGNVVTWSFSGMIIPKESILRKEEVLTELKEILKAYGVFGYTMLDHMYKEDTSVHEFLNF